MDDLSGCAAWSSSRRAGGLAPCAGVDMYLLVLLYRLDRHDMTVHITLLSSCLTSVVQSSRAHCLSAVCPVGPSPSLLPQTLLCTSSTHSPYSHPRPVLASVRCLLLPVWQRLQSQPAHTQGLIHYLQSPLTVTIYSLSPAESGSRPRAHTWPCSGWHGVSCGGLCACICHVCVCICVSCVAPMSVMANTQ